MTTNEATTAQLARERATDRLKQASGALTAAATKIAEAFGIPDGINGLTKGEFLGRISFVISLERDLRRAGEDVFAQRLIRAQLAADDPIPNIKDADTLGIVEEVTKGAPAELPPTSPALAVERIPGLTVQIVKALKMGGIQTLEDVEKFTDDALLTLNGIANPSLKKLRACCAAVRAG